MTGMGGRAKASAIPVAARPDLAPTPHGGAVTFALECRTSRDAVRGSKHRVTINPDWSVTTPHDLDAERVAAAFGGFTSCVPLVEKTVPAFRSALGMLTRRSYTAFRRDKRGHWRLPRTDAVDDCCAAHAFRSIESAARHVRSADHLARASGAPGWQLAAVMRAAERVWGPWESAPLASAALDAAERLVREPGGVAELWRSGIPPTALPALADAAPAVHEAFPLSYYLGVVYGSADRGWLGDVLTHRPDPDTAAWLAWLENPQRLGVPAEWGRWLGWGLPRAEVLAALERAIASDRVVEYSRATGWTERAVARAVVAWSAAGCSPTVEQFVELCRHGAEATPPSRSAIDVLQLEAERLGTGAAYDRTRLGVMLAVLGTRAAVVHSLQHGFTDPVRAESDRISLPGRTL